MENFKIDPTVDFSKPENQDRLLKEHQAFMESKFIKPIQEKLKTYEAQINQYQEQTLFQGLNEKQVKIAKSLITSQYQDLDQATALTKIKADYAEIFNSNENQAKPEANKEISNQFFNPKSLLDLDANANAFKAETLKKAETMGVKDNNETINLLKTLFAAD